MNDPSFNNPKPDSNPHFHPGNDRDAVSNEAAIVNRIKESLMKIGYAQFSSVECSMEENEIVLSGRLDSFYLKQVAQSVAYKVLGGQQIRNEIEVL